jgi:predicted metal-binding membrane protein
MMRWGFLNRQGVLWLGFFALILLAWGGIFAQVAQAPIGLWGVLCTTAAAAGFFDLWGMWALMAAAMMLPTFVPALRTFVNMGAAGATRPIEAAALVMGYALVWVAGSALGAAAQLALSRVGVLAADGSSLSVWLTVALLVAAGLYQLSILKAACLAKCRMPLTYFMGRWAPGLPRALSMGAELGLICFGCCWALMALAFVGGTMNLVWMGLATLFMVLEKLPQLGRPLTRPAGFALIGAGVLLALRTLLT